MKVDDSGGVQTAEQLATYQVSPHFLGALRAIALELGEEVPWPETPSPATSARQRPASAGRGLP